jgi:signal transduction histidine kinase
MSGKNGMSGPGQPHGVLNRTLVYGLLVAAVGAAYVLGVSNIDAWFGLDADWLAPPQVAAAGLVAVLFHPLRTGLESLADRIVYGRRLRPAEAVARIAALGSATAVGAASLRELARIVATGLGTGSAAVRLRLSDGSGVVYSWPESAEKTWTVGATLLPVSYRGEIVGALELPAGPGRAPARRRRALRDELVAAAGVVLHNAGLDIELAHQVHAAEIRAAEIRASRWRIVAAQDSERRELERDLHDGAQPGLTAVRLALGLVTHLTDTGRVQAANKALDDLCAQLSSAATGLGHTLRGLDPEILRRFGVAAAVRELIDELGVRDRAWIEDGTDGLRLRSDIEATAYFCCAEAVQNAAKHSPGARLAVRLHHREHTGTLVFEVTDEGPGFDQGAHPGGAGSGLQNMADRAATVGGTLTIASGPHGTTVTGEIPALRA